MTRGPISIKIPDRLWDDLQDAVNRSGLNRSQYILQALTYYMFNVDPTKGATTEKALQGATRDVVDQAARSGLELLNDRQKGTEREVEAIKEAVSLLVDQVAELQEKTPSEDEALKREAESFLARLS